MPNASETVSLLGLSISRLDLAGAVSACQERVRQGQGGAVCFVNVHTLTESQDQPAVRQALESAAFRFPDGMPLVWSARLQGQPVGSRVCGPDFMASWLSNPGEQPHGFLGASREKIEKLAARYQLPQWVGYAPPMRAFSPEAVKEDWDAFKGEAARAGVATPRVVWVGLGAPKQELWMEQASLLAPDTLFLGVGAAFDFHSGSKERAPIWMQKSGLEWAYRMTQEPGRLSGRYMETNSRFAWLMLKEIISGNKQ